MTILTLDRAPVVVARRARRPGWFARFLAAVYESRMRSARAVIARHRGGMPIATARPNIGPQLHNVVPLTPAGPDRRAFSSLIENVENDPGAIVARRQRR